MNIPFKLAIVVVLHAVFAPVDAWAEADQATIERTAMQSSTIASAGYIPRGGMLEIEFRSGAIYRYKGVPKRVFAAFARAQSKGRFFGSEIRGKYPFEKTNGASR